MAKTVYIRYFPLGNHQVYGHIRCIYIRFWSTLDISLQPGTLYIGLQPGTLPQIPAQNKSIIKIRQQHQRTCKHASSSLHHPIHQSLLETEGMRCTHTQALRWKIVREWCSFCVRCAGLGVVERLQHYPRAIIKHAQSVTKHACVHTHTHTHTHKHTHTHTHTHTYKYIHTHLQSTPRQSPCPAAQPTHKNTHAHTHIQIYTLTPAKYAPAVSMSCCTAITSSMASGTTHALGGGGAASASVYVIRACH